MKPFKEISERLSNNAMTRILAFGSSNTERAAHSDGCYNWLDWLDVCIHATHGRVHHIINSGVGGQTSRDLLDRFDRDAGSYSPDIMFLTVGGNDCNPEKAVSLQMFWENLKTIIERTRTVNQKVIIILQTYYSIDYEILFRDDGGERADSFYLYMDVVRETAESEQCLLVDNLTRWERLRHSDIQTYRSLMRDPWHVNPLGNMVWGLDLSRKFGVQIPENLVELCQEGKKILNLLDDLENKE